MRRNMDLDERLVDEAVALGHHATRSEAVNEALRAYVAYRRRLLALDVFGTIDFDPSFDAKGARKRT